MNIYLDYSATSPMLPSILNTLGKAFAEDFYNPSSPYKAGLALKDRIEKNKKRVLSQIGFKDHQIVFTASATESNNTICQGALLQEGDEVLLSLADHSSLTTFVTFFLNKKVKVKHIPLKEGQIDYESLAYMDLSSVRLVLLTHVNGQSGIELELERVIPLLRSRCSQAHIHVDSVQALGRSFLKFSSNVQSEIDSQTLSVHKMGGPKGISALVLKNGHRIAPLLLGGGQQHGMRSSTEVFPLVEAFCETIFYWDDEKVKERRAFYSLMNEKFLSFSEEFKRDLFLPVKNEISNTGIITVVVPSIFADVLVRVCEQKGLFFSTTSACSSRKKSKSPLLSALGVDEKDHLSVIRLSAGYNSTENEIDQALEILKSEIQKLRKISRR